MKSRQKDFLALVILPHLVQMAANDELPSDMTQLSLDHFEDVVNDYNLSSDGRLDRMVANALPFLSADCEGDIKRVLQEIDNDSSIDDNDTLDHCHPDLQVAEKFENLFLVGEFFQMID